MKTEITINGFNWNVYFVNSTYPDLVGENGEQNAYGITFFREGEIYIDKALPNGLMKKTVLHELTHALAFSYGESIDLENEERICDFIGAHFDELKTLRKAVLKAL